MPAAPSNGFDALYRDVAPALFSWISLHVWAPLRADLDPEDVLQEVACRAYAGRESFDSELGDFRAWIFGIAKNVLLGALQRVDRGRAGPGREWLTTGGLARLPDEATSVTGHVARDDQLAAFLERVETLPEEDRLLVMLRGLERLPFDDVGRSLGLTPGTAAKRWERLCARLREGSGRVLLAD